MSSSREEIVARMSMDVSPVERALTGLRGKLSGFAATAGHGGFSGFMHSLESAHGGLEKFVGIVGHQFAALLSFAGLVQLGHSVLEFAHHLEFQSEELGVSTDFLQAYEFAAIQSGTGAEKAAKSLEIFTRKIGQAREAGKESIKVGETVIPLNDVAGNAKGTEQLFLEVADAIHGIEEPSLRAAAAFHLFGKGGVAMVPILELGSQGFKDLSDSINKLSTEDIEQLAEIEKKITGFWFKIKIGAGKGAIAIGETIGEVFDVNSELIANLIEGAKAPKSLLNTLFPGTSLIAGAVKDTLKTMHDKEEDAALNKAAKAAQIDKHGQVQDLEKEAKALEARQAKEEKAAELQAKIDKVIAESQTKQLTGKAKLEELTSQRIDLETELRDIMDAGIDKNLGPQERELEVRKELLGVNLGIKTVQDDIAAAMLKQEQARAAVEDARLALSAAKEDRSKFTLEELATSRIGFTGRLGQEQILARQAAFLEKRAEIERKLGFGDASQRDFTAADAIRNLLPDLKSTEKDRFKVLEKNLAKQVDTLNVLLNREATDGLHIALVNSN